MSKRPDFASDLANLNENVAAEVGTVLQVLLQQKTAAHSGTANNKPESVTPTMQSTDADGTQPEKPAPPTQVRRQRSTNRSRLSFSVERTEPKKNVNFNLYIQTDELLTEAALRQRIKKQPPCYRQDIVEAALTEWFRKHGYVPGRDSESDP